MGRIYGQILYLLYKENQRKMTFRSIKAGGILLFIAALLLVGIKGEATTEKNAVQQEVAEQIIRFHVLANSDSNADQRLKLKVKDEVANYITQKLTHIENREQAEEVVIKELESMNQLAEEIIREQGYQYTVNTKFEACYFPVKMYGDMVFPPGEYDAIRIEIGKAEGKNWWCVMYPALCQIEGTYQIVPEESKKALKHVLSEESYQSLLLKEDKNIKIKPKIKILDWIFQK